MSRSSEATTGSRWSDVLADEALLRSILTYVGPKQYRFVAPVNRQWNRVYVEAHNGDTETMSKNALASRRTLLILCRENDKSWRDDLFLYRQVIENDDCVLSFWPGAMVAERGDLRSLQWLRARHWKLAIHPATQQGKSSFTGVCGSAAHTGRLAILKWARANGCDWDTYACKCAALHGHLEVLQWARANGCPWNEDTCLWAARGGHLKVVKWVLSNSYGWGEEICNWAAAGGHVKVLRWARAKGYEWDEACFWAGSNGHLDVLKWAIANGCEWGESTCEVAATCGELELLKWAIAKGCPWNPGRCLEGATGRHPHVQRWIEAKIDERVSRVESATLGAELL